MRPENCGPLQQANATRELVSQLLSAVCRAAAPATGSCAPGNVAPEQADCSHYVPCSPPISSCGLCCMVLCLSGTENQKGDTRICAPSREGRCSLPCSAASSQRLSSLLLLLPSLNAFDYSVILDLMSHRHFKGKK